MNLDWLHFFAVLPNAETFEGVGSRSLGKVNEASCASRSLQQWDADAQLDPLLAKMNVAVSKPLFAIGSF